jgi:alpha-glucosidase
VNVPGLGRDGSRTPMPWDGSAGAGFSSAEPWLPLAGDSALLNAESVGADANSLLNLYRRLIGLRRAHPALSSGTYRPVAPRGNLLAFERRADNERVLVVLNFSAKTEEYSVKTDTYSGILLLSTGPDRGGDAVCGTIALRPHEAVILLDR